MDRSVKAALLSALVFPGAGQFHLKRAARGCIFLLPTLAAVLYFAGQAMARASAMVDQIMAGTMPLDPVLIAARLENSAGSPWMTASVVLMIACWAASIVDAYLIGRSMAPPRPQDPRVKRS